MLLKHTKKLLRIHCIFQRGFATSSHVNPKACVVGSGPAAFSVCQTLLKQNTDVQVDMFEKLPVPFGLVRYGVAPDHQDVKNSINNYNKTACNSRFNFFGNVNVGKDIKVEDLCKNYHAVILCHGAQGERKLGINGENYLNVLTSNQFVGWYNGCPEQRNLEINLKGKSAVIIGIGNVALDCARMLLKPTSDLQSSDISANAVKVLKDSTITNVHVVGRRGPLQMACTRKELSEICNLNHIETFVDMSCFSSNILNAVKKRNLSKRKIQRLIKYLMSVSKDFTQKSTSTNRGKYFNVNLLLRPVEVLSNDGLNATSVKFQKIIMLETDDPFNPHFEVSDDFIDIECDLVISCIGYNSNKISSPLLTYSKDNLVHTKGVINAEYGLYAAGWCTSGPVGVLADTSNSGHDIAYQVLSDLPRLIDLKGNCFDEELVPKKLKSKNITHVSWSGWKKIDQFEINKGKIEGKVREKIVDINKMVSVSKTLTKIGDS